MVAAFADTMDRKLLAFGVFFPYFLSERVVARVSKLWKRMQRTGELVRVREITLPLPFPRRFFGQNSSARITLKLLRSLHGTRSLEMFDFICFFPPHQTSPSHWKEGAGSLWCKCIMRTENNLENLFNLCCWRSKTKSQKKKPVQFGCVCVLRFERWVCWKSTNTDNTYCVVVVLGFGEIYVFVRATGRERPRRWVWVR